MVKYLLPFVLLVFLVSVHAQQINWSTLTASQLKALNATVFASISATNLSSIPPPACAGFQASQIAMLPVSAAPGFNYSQIGQLSWEYSTDACAGFYGAFMAAMQPSAFSGFFFGCIGALKGSALTGWTPEQLSQVPPPAFSGFTASNIAQLNPAAFSALTPTQLSNLTAAHNTAGCAGLTAQQVQNIPAPSFAAFSTPCVGLLGNFSFSLISADQLNNLSSNGVKGLTARVVSNMNPAAGAGFTPQQIAQLVASFTYDACSGFPAGVVANMPAACFGAWQSTCVGYLPAMAFSQVSQAQIAALSTAAVSGLTSAVVMNLPAASGAGWTAANLAALSPNIQTPGCKGFQGQHVATMPAAAFAGWTQPCVMLLPAMAWNMTNAEQIAQLSTQAAAGVTLWLVANMPSSAAAGWTGAQLNAIGSVSPPTACQGFNSAQFNQIQPTAFPGLTTQCISLLSTSIFRLITIGQIDSFTPQQIAGISLGQTAAIPDSVLTSIPLVTFGYFSPDGVSGFTPNQLLLLIQQYQTSFTDTLTVSQLASYAAFNVSALLAFKALIPSTLAPLYQSIPAPNTTWLQLALSPAVEITQSDIQNFAYSTLNGITAQQAPLMESPALTYIATSQAVSMVYLLPDTVRAFSCAQLNELYPGRAYLRPESREVFDAQSQACPGGLSGTTTHYTTSSSSSGSHHKGKSGGQVAGIFFAVVIGVIILAVIAFFAIRQYRENRKNFPPLLAENGQTNDL